MTPQDDIDPDIVRRITDAAEQLFDESGRQAIPNVDAVRRRARANMNHASLVMKRWRQLAKTQPGAAEDTLPEALRHSSEQLLLALWNDASKAASTRLAGARATWEDERRELEEFRTQLSAAFDAQSQELTAADAMINRLRAELTESNAAQVLLRQQASDADQARAGNERVLSHAREEVETLRQLLSTSQSAQARLAKQWQDHVVTQAAQAERLFQDQLKAAEQLGQARQEAAELRTRLSAMTVAPVSTNKPPPIKRLTNTRLPKREPPAPEGGK